MIKDKIAYLIGAGASFGAIKLAKDLGTDMIILSEKILDYSPKGGNNQQENLKKLSNKLKEYGTVAKGHYTIDTYAKKLVIRRDNKKLHELKSTISIYFMISSLFDNYKCDDRYDSFWASIISENGSLPKNVRMISWNYDVQMECSLLEYYQDYRQVESWLNLQINSRQLTFTNDYDGFTLFKLNGSANKVSYQVDSQRFIRKNIDTLNKVKLDEKIIEFANVFDEMINRIKNPDIMFAWELSTGDGQMGKSLVSCAHDAIKDAKTLVIIGYSFPFFNREIDRNLFKDIVFDNIYIQDPNANSVLESIESVGIQFKNCKLLSNLTDKFYLPPNL